jgi:hypothetical protein
MKEEDNANNSYDYIISNIHHHNMTQKRIEKLHRISNISNYCIN